MTVRSSRPPGTAHRLISGAWMWEKAFPDFRRPKVFPRAARRPHGRRTEELDVAVAVAPQSNSALKPSSVICLSV